MTPAAGHLDANVIYPRVQQFYALQMQLLDEADIEGYAATFTEDAEFAHSPGRPAARTRTGIVEDLRDFHRRFADDPMRRRHLFTMINLAPALGGEIMSTAYCLVLKIRPGRSPELVSCVVRDVLVAGEDVAGECPGESGVLVRSRHIDYD